MKAANITTMAMLVAGILGVYAWAPVYSASQDSGPSYTESAPGAQAPSVQSPVGAAPAEIIMPGKKPDACARLDKNQDGYISLSEFKASGKPIKLFKGADVGRRGKLNMEECNKALTG